MTLLKMYACSKFLNILIIYLYAVKGEIDCTKSCMSEIGVKSKPEDGDLVMDKDASLLDVTRKRLLSVLKFVWS